MSFFEVKLSGNPSSSVSRAISNTLTHLNETYLRGERLHTAVCIDYLDHSQWFVKGISLAEVDRNMMSIAMTIEQELAEDQYAVFAKAVFHSFDDVIGDLHELSSLRIIGPQTTRLHYKNSIDRA